MMKKLNLLVLLSGLLIGGSFVTSCNPCKDVDCVNGTCNEGDCDCDDGWEAADCTTEKRTKFIGDYSGNEACDSALVNTYSIEITTATTDVSNIIIYNLGGYDVDVKATVDAGGLSFTIPNQSVSAGPNTAYTFSGSGVKTGNTLDIEYTIIVNGTGLSDGCEYTALKDN